MVNNDNKHKKQVMYLYKINKNEKHKLVKNKKRQL